MEDKITYYLVGGINITDRICEPVSVWKRSDLVAPPSLLKYNEESVDGIRLYVNSMGSCIFIMPYGDFTHDEMLADYNMGSESVYYDRYNALIPALNERFELNIKDVDWIMTLCSGKREIDSSHMSLGDALFEENVEFVTFLDSAMTYQSVQAIGAFFKSITLHEKLTRYEQYKISYYMQEMKLLQSPVLYLTNSQEKACTEEIYKEWEISEQIELVLDIANQAINIFSFISDYKKSNEINYSAIFMSYISTLLLYESIGKLLEFLWPEGQNYFGLLLKGIIILVTGICAWKLLKGLCFEYKDKRNLKKHTSNLTDKL